MLRLCLNRFAPGEQVGFNLVKAPSPSDTAQRTYDVIVTNDGPVDGFQQWLDDAYPWVICTQGPQQGPAANRNHGARNAQGQWLVFIDDDCVPEPNLLEAYANVLSQQNCQAVEGAIHPAGPVAADLIDCPVNTTGNYFWSANICIEHTVFAEINGFDEQYPYPAMEDCDLYLRLKAITDIPFAQDAIVTHPPRRLSLRQVLTKANRHIPSFAYYTKKNGRRLNLQSLFSVLVEHIHHHLRNWIKCILCGKWGWSIYHLYLLSIGTLKLAWAYKKSGKVERA